MVRVIRKNPYAAAAAAFAGLFLFSLFFNRAVEYRSLYMDDLSNYYFYIRQDFLQYALLTAPGQVHYRPVFYAFLYPVCRLITGHPQTVLVINNLLQAAVGTAMFLVMRSLGTGMLLSFSLAVLCLSSHLSYFNIGQMIGPVESLSMLFALILYGLSLKYVYRDAENRKAAARDRGLLLLFYFLICMTHERYMGLAVPLACALLAARTGKKEKLRDIAMLAAVLAAVLVIRYAALHTVVPVGTSQSDVVENFSLRQFVRFALDQILFVLGINAGPAYLTGIEWSSVTAGMKGLILAGAVLWILLALTYAAGKIRAFQKEKSGEKNGTEDGLYGGDARIDGITAASLAMYVASSSVTIRLEMRWIYVSFAVCLVFTGYMLTWLKKHLPAGEHGWARPALCAAAVLFFVLRFPAESYYHRYYPQIFFYEAEISANSLADQTVYAHSREELEQNGVWLLSNEMGLDPGIYKYFYEPFFGERRKGDGRVIDCVAEQVEAVLSEREGTGENREAEKNRVRAELVKELKEGGSILLEECPETRTFRPMTDETYRGILEAAESEERK